MTEVSNRLGHHAFLLNSTPTLVPPATVLDPVLTVFARRDAVETRQLPTGHRSLPGWSRRRPYGRRREAPGATPRF